MQYRKSAKGQAEIDAGVGERELSQRLRMVLVLVDGKRTEVDLQQMLPAATPQALQRLADGGYIEPVAAAPKPVEAESKDSLFLASAMPSRFAVASRPDDELATDEQRGHIERSLKRALGPAAAGLVASVRTARTVGDLVAVLKLAKRAIANARGWRVADEFASRYGSLSDS